jgi:acyl-CoA thioester hydrolase
MKRRILQRRPKAQAVEKGSDARRRLKTAREAYSPYVTLTVEGANEADGPLSAACFDVYRNRVRPEWIDHNGHMNMGYYVVVFDLATDEFFRSIGLDEAHRRAARVTTFALEAHVTYHREVREGDPLRFTTLLLGHDAKRLHYFHQMYHAEEGYLAATNELMSLHVSDESRRGAPMAPEVLERLRVIQTAHDRLPRPPQVGRRLGLSTPPTTR